MHDDDNAVPPKRRSLDSPPLDRLGVAELEQYVDELLSEIERAQAEISRKRGHRSAAESVFKF